jgi:hypothetical protein
MISERGIFMEKPVECQPLQRPRRYDNINVDLAKIGWIGFDQSQFLWWTWNWLLLL